MRVFLSLSRLIYKFSWLLFYFFKIFWGLQKQWKKAVKIIIEFKALNYFYAYALINVKNIRDN